MRFRVPSFLIIQLTANGMKVPLLKRPGLSVFTISLIVTLAFISFVYFCPTKPPFVFIEAETETLSYYVIRPQVAAVPLVDAKIIGLPLTNCGKLSESQTSITALLQPAIHTIVRYRHSGKKISIQLSNKNSVGAIHFADETICALPANGITFVIATPSHESPAGPAVRPLPIAGPGEIGVEQGAPSITNIEHRIFNTMKTGSLRVYGRTAFPPNRGALYPAEDAEFPLPAGGRLDSGEDFTSGNISNVAAWYGIAHIGENAFQVSVTTESKDLRLFRPGSSGDSERFAVSLFGRLFNDPSVAVISLAVVVFSIVMQVISGWIGIWRND